MGELAFSILLAVHVAAGLISLIPFWVPVVARKGGVNHRKIGIVYVKLMWLVVISAACMSLLNLFSGRIVQAIFLGFLSLLTAKPLWLGIAVLKQKRNPAPGFQRAGLILNGLLLVCGLAMIAYGLSLLGETVALLMIAFGGLGMLGLPEIIAAFKPQERTESWLRGHIGDMIVSGIAAYTAFFAFGAGQYMATLFSGTWATIPWLAPTAIGSLGIVYARSRFIRKTVKV